MTTNGYLLERHADALVEAGIDRVNVSIDSLARDRFHEITRRDALPEVLRGLAAIAAHERVRPIKVNAVAMRDFTEAEAIGFAELARSSDYQVRFIEFMPLDGDRNWRPDQVLTGEELRATIDAVYPLEPLPREPHATARVYRFADGAGEIGFINPVSEPFCADCNRIRLTAEGELRTCLFSLRETDLREPLRAGATDAELETIIRGAVWRKELKHRVNEPGFVPPPRTMSAIGGWSLRRLTRLAGGSCRGRSPPSAPLTGTCWGLPSPTTRPRGASSFISSTSEVVEMNLASTWLGRVVRVGRPHGSPEGAQMEVPGPDRTRLPHAGRAQRATSRVAVAFQVATTSAPGRARAG